MNYPIFNVLILFPNNQEFHSTLLMMFNFLWLLCFNSLRNVQFGISHFSQIVHIRQGMNLLKSKVYPVVVFFSGFADGAFSVVHVSEYDSIGRTSLSTSCCYVGICKRTVFFLRFQLTFL